GEDLIHSTGLQKSSSFQLLEPCLPAGLDFLVCELIASPRAYGVAPPTVRRPRMSSQKMRGAVGRFQIHDASIASAHKAYTTAISSRHSAMRNCASHSTNKPVASHQCSRMRDKRSAATTLCTTVSRISIRCVRSIGSLCSPPRTTENTIG